MEISAIDAQIQDLTDMVQSHTAAILSLKRQHNELIPVGQLPDEVLEIIFACLRDVCTDSEPSEPSSLLVPGWIPITWVAHRFRGLCFQYHSLWTRIGNYRHKWLFALVDRSIPSPIDVHLNVDVHGKYRLKRLMKSVFRMRTLDLDGDTQTIHEYVVPALSIPTPELQTLSIQTNRVAEQIGTVRRRMSEPGIPFTFAHHAPHLRELELGPCVRLTSVSHELLPSLEQLVVSGRYSLNELHAMLRGTPHLKTLEIVNTGRATSQSADPVPYTVVNLPRLDRLTFVISSHEQLPNLLNILRMPSLTCVRIAFALFDFVAHSEELPKLTLVLTSLVQQGSNDPIQSVRLSSLTDPSHLRTQRIVIWRSSGAGTQHATLHSLKGKERPANAQFIFRPNINSALTPDFHLLGFYRDFCAALPLQDLRTLTLELNLGFTAREWADILNSLSRVDTLKLIGDRIFPAAVDALASPLILPSLSRLKLCCTFRITRTPSPLMPTLLDVAKVRATEQARLRIAFEDCNRYSVSIDRKLREFADVTWDNVSIFDDSRPAGEEPWLTLLE